MENEKKFVEGLFFNKPHENAPDWVLGEISVSSVKQFVEWLNANAKDDKVRISVKNSKTGKAYCELNDWQPQKQGETAQADEDEENVEVPF